MMQFKLRYEDVRNVKFKRDELKSLLFNLLDSIGLHISSWVVQLSEDKRVCNLAIPVSALLKPSLEPEGTIIEEIIKNTQFKTSVFLGDELKSLISRLNINGMFRIVGYDGFLYIYDEFVSETFESRVFLDLE